MKTNTMKPQSQQTKTNMIIMLDMQTVSTKFRRADEVTDSAHAAIVFPLGLIELHADPLTTGELCRSTKPQSAGLKEQRQRHESPQME